MAAVWLVGFELAGIETHATWVALVTLLALAPAGVVLERLAKGDDAFGIVEIHVGRVSLGALPASAPKVSPYTHPASLTSTSAPRR